MPLHSLRLILFIVAFSRVALADHCTPGPLCKVSVDSYTGITTYTDYTWLVVGLVVSAVLSILLTLICCRTRQIRHENYARDAEAAAAMQQTQNQFYYNQQDQYRQFQRVSIGPAPIPHPPTAHITSSRPF